MTSKFSIDNRELLQRISSGEAVVGIDFGNLIVRDLAAFRLAAMDSSESVELPLDYLQGHKDGLEWAAKLAEANHPETGDWLYDDPIELAKAIRKGPDMPPAQPVADSEPVAVIDLANLDYLLSGADADVWPPEREEMGDVLLYLHAQPAPVVPDGYVMVPKEPTKEMLDEFDSIIDYGAEDSQDAWRRLLAVAPQLPGSESATVPGKWIPVSERMPENKPGSCEYLVFETLNNRVNHDYWNAPDKGDDAFTPFWNYYGEHVTHWMPLPAVPQEVKGE